MPDASFGTAQLGNLHDSVQPLEMIQTAWDAGFRRFDTAPMYVHGRSEVDLGRFLAGRTDLRSLTTKVGMLPEKERPVLRRVVSAAKAVLPGAVTDRVKSVVRPDPGPAAEPLSSGRFGVDAVRTSVEASLRHLGGRVDRLLLHEVLPHDVTPELLTLLSGYVTRGDVGQLGVATQNHHTLEALAAGGEVFTAVNYAVGPLHEPLSLPANVCTRVGHGLLGGGGEHLRRLQHVLDTDHDLQAQWSTATRGTEFDGPRGLGDVLLSRAADLDVDEVLVGSTRIGNVAPAHDRATRTQPLPPAISGVLADLVTHAQAACVAQRVDQ